MNKILRLIFIVATFVCNINLALAQAELDHYLETAANNNPGLKASFNRYLATLEKVPQVGTLPDPQIMFGIFIQPVETRVGAQRGNISISQAFPWFGTLGAQKEAVSIMAKADYEKFENAKLMLFNDVKVNYFNLYFVEKSIQITELNIDLLETFKQLAQTNFESAKSGFVDVLRVQMELEELENKLLYMQDSRQPLLARFEELLNTSIDDPIIFPDTLWEEQIVFARDSLIASIQLNNPQLKQLDYESESFASQAEAARRMGLPSFNVGFNYINVSERTDMDVPGNGKDAFMFPQVGVRIPLYRNKYRSMVKENLLRQESVQFSRQNTENKLITELEKVYRDLVDARRRIALYKKQFDYANQSLNLLTLQYSTDGKNFEEVIRMERRKLEYSLMLEKARTEHNVYASYINYLNGQ